MTLSNRKPTQRIARRTTMMNDWRITNRILDGSEFILKHWIGRKREDDRGRGQNQTFQLTEEEEKSP